MGLDRRNQQVAVAGLLIIHLEVDDDLILGFLDLVTILPNSVGLLALPLRITSVDVSNTLRILPATCVSPPKARALVWLTTFPNVSVMPSISRFRPSKAACFQTSEARFTPLAISPEKALDLSHYPARGFQQFTIHGLDSLFALFPVRPAGSRDLRYAALHTSHTVPQFGSHVAAIAVTLFINRVSTRSPSPSRLLPVG
jgi:hypothetical protein